MRRNIELTGGLIYSQRVMLELVKKGAPRVQAYEVVQRLALGAWEKTTPFKDLVEKDPFVTRYLTVDVINACFNPNAYTRHVPAIFARVFGKSGNARIMKKKRQPS